MVAGGTVLGGQACADDLFNCRALGKEKMRTGREIYKKLFVSVRNTLLHLAR